MALRATPGRDAVPVVRRRLEQGAKVEALGLRHSGGTATANSAAAHNREMTELAHHESPGTAGVARNGSYVRQAGPR